jgi:hypothetical protein
MMKRKMTPTGMDTVARFLQHRLQSFSVYKGLKEAITSEQKNNQLKNIFNGVTWGKNINGILVT